MTKPTIKELRMNDKFIAKLGYQEREILFAKGARVKDVSRSYDVSSPRKRGYCFEVTGNNNAFVFTIGGIYADYTIIM